LLAIGKRNALASGDQVETIAPAATGEIEYLLGESGFKDGG
jgi:hypothetical protein